MVIAKSSVVAQEDVVINGKTYPGCFHISTNGGAGATDSWLAAGVGIVKAEFVGRTGGKTISTLREFKPAKENAK